MKKQTLNHFIRILFLFSYFFFSLSIYPQIGIGTSTPTASLEIKSTNTGIPALELNPQSAPEGSAMGQIAVIGDMLYMYDSTRGKWLSVESTALQFGKDKKVDDSGFVKFGGDVKRGTSGPVMPFDGTIVCVTSQSSMNSTASFVLSINGATTGTSFTMSSSDYFIKTNYNIDFNQGQYINIFSSDTSNNLNIAIVVWVKWRK